MGMTLLSELEYINSLEKADTDDNFEQFEPVLTRAEEALIKVGDTVEGFATSKIVHQNAKDLGIKLKLLDYLMSIYEVPKSLTEDKGIFNASEIESDSNFKLK